MRRLGNLLIVGIAYDSAIIALSQGKGEPCSCITLLRNWRPLNIH